MANTYDAIIIGGGHNGLTSGAYFARAGARTVVLEARDKTGGAADTSAPFADHPEINVTTYSYVMSLMPPTIIRELKLKQFGYDVTPFGPYFQAFPDGRAITVYADDAQKSYDSIAQFSKKDADTLPKWEAWMKGVSDVLGPLLLSVPPHVGSTKLGDLIPQLQTAWNMRKLGQRGVADVTRLFTMSVTDLLDDWFESDAIKAMLTVNGVIGTWAGPDEPGTAYVMLHHSIGDVGDGHLGSWGFQQGGMGAVSDSIRRSAESFGAEIRTGAKVKKILVRGGRAVGVALENGEELRAPVVVTCIHPKIAFLDLLDRHELPGRLRLGHRALEDPLGHGEGERRDQRAARLHVGARQGAAGPPHRVGRALPLAPVRGARVPGRAHRPQAGGGALRGRHDPDHARQEARARGRARLLDVHAVGARRLERPSRTATSSTPTRSGSSTGTTSWRRTSRTRSSTTR